MSAETWLSVTRDLLNRLTQVGFYLVHEDRYIVERTITHVGGGETVATDTIRCCRVCDESLEGPGGFLYMEHHKPDCPIPAALISFIANVQINTLDEDGESDTIERED